MSCCPSPACAPIQPCSIENFGVTFPSLVGPMGPPGGPGTYVENYALLRLLDGSAFTAGYIAFVAGANVINDQGGGLFEYDPTSVKADNNGTVIAPANGIGRWLRIINGPINLMWFGPDITGATDSAAKIQAALDLCQADGGEIWSPPAILLALVELQMYSQTSLACANGRGNVGDALMDGAVIIRGQHAGNSVLNLVGQNGCYLQNVNIQGSITTSPKVGLLLGRAVGLGSAGDHLFSSITVSGYFSSCSIASISSENNKWFATNVVLNGGGGKIAFFNGQSPDFGIAGVFGGSNIATEFHGMTIINYVDAADAVGYYLDSGANTINHEWFGGFIGMRNGVYIHIRCGITDGKNVPGPISFRGVSGEGLIPGDTVDRGFKITSEGAVVLGNPLGISGLTIDGCRFPTTAGGNFLELVTPCFLKDSYIKVPAQNNISSFAGILTNTFVDLGSPRIPTFYGANGMKVLDGDLVLERTDGSASTLILKSLDATDSAGISLKHAAVEKAAMTAAGDGNTYLDYQGELRGRDSIGYAQQFSISALGIGTFKELVTPGAAVPFMTLAASATSGAGAQVATLTNAPVAGNPTSWIPFSDGGGNIAYIPIWKT